MRGTIALAVAALLAAGAAAAQPAKTLPLKRGFYARVGKGCATHGSFARYSDLLTFHGDGLNDTAHGRRIVATRNAGSTYEVKVSSDAFDGRPKRRLTWLILVLDDERFHLAGTDDGMNLTDDYVYCGKDIP